jgi:hypothetical protein
LAILSLRKNLSRSDAAREYLHLALPESVIQEFATKPEHPRAARILQAPRRPDGEPRNPWHAVGRS